MTLSKWKLLLPVIGYRVLLILISPFIRRESRAFNTISLGTKYGGKVLLDDVQFNDGILISGGAGEDISFDIEYVSKFSGICVIVDPTVKAKRHVEDVLGRVGEVSQEKYSEGGKQSPKSYDLSKILPGSITFVSKALWSESGKLLKLHPPKDPQHASWSLLNIQNTDLEANLSHDVETISIPDLLKDSKLKFISVLKLDIEGAQFESLSGMFAQQIFPKQMIIEVDELYFLSLQRFIRAIRCLMLIKNNGYVCINRNIFDFSFIRNSDLIEKSKAS